MLDSLSGDAELAAAMRAAGNVVLPFSFGVGGPADARLPEPPAAVAATAFRIVHGPDAASSMPASVGDRRARADPRARRGRVHARPHERRLDRDGAARFEFPAVAYGANVYPSFALEVARQHLGVPRDKVRLELGRGVWLGDRLVPTDDRTQFVVNYRGSGRFQRVSFAQLLAGTRPGC